MPLKAMSYDFEDLRMLALAIAGGMGANQLQDWFPGLVLKFSELNGAVLMIEIRCCIISECLNCYTITENSISCHKIRYSFLISGSS